MNDELTQSEWLTWFWYEIYKGEYSRYELLKFASTMRGYEKPMPRTQLKFLRNQFINDHVTRKRYPMRKNCFLCGHDPDERKVGHFMVRHHIIALNKWGSNRKINIVSLCSRCHCYFHPWLKPTLSEWIEEQAEKT